MDDLNILLKAKLDINNSIKNINNQIDEISKKLKDVNISLNIEDLKSTFESMFKDIDSKVKKTKVYDSKETKNEISKTIKDFKSLKSEIDSLLNNGFKKHKTSTSFIDLGEGNKLKRIVEEYNDELNHSVSIIKQIDVQTGNLISVEKKLTDNIKARTLAEEKATAIKVKNQEKLEKQIREVELAKKNVETSLRNIAKSQDRYDETEYKRLIDILNKIDPAAKDAMLQLKELKAEVNRFGVASKEASNTTNSFSDSLKRFTAFYGIHEVLQLAERSIRAMSEAVMELDACILEVQKVANINDMNGFIKQAYQAADSLKIIGTDFINGIADASRMGYSLDEAFDMSSVANKMVIVGDGIESVEHAMGVLQSTLALFSKKGYEAEDVLNLINETANNTGVSFGELSDMISRSASVGLSGSSLESIIALNTTLFEVTRNAEMSATAINMINQRLMGLDIETGEQSLELVSKLGKELKALTGVDVFDVDGGLKDTATILEEVAQKWNGLTKEVQLATSTLIGNNRHAKSVSALMSNWDTYYKSLESSANSANSAQEELQAYLDSTTGKVEAMKGALQELFITTLSSDLVGSLAEITTNVIKLVNELGGLVPILTTLSGMIITLKANSLSNWLGDAIVSISGIAKSMLGMTTATKGATVATSAFGVASKAAFGWIGLAIAGISALVAGLNYMAGETDRAKEKISSLNQEITQLSTDSKTAKELAKQYDVLNKVSKAQGLNNEEQAEFTRIQNELKSLIPEINGYYDEQGNFIATETDMVKKLNEVYDELIAKKREEKAETSKDLLKDYQKDYDDLQKKIVNNYKPMVEQIQNIINGTESAKGTLYAGLGLDELNKSLHSAQTLLNDATSSQSQISKDMKQAILDSVYATESWNNATDEQTDAMAKFISNLESEELLRYVEAMNDGTLSSDDFVSEMLKLPEVQNAVNEALKKTKEEANGVSSALQDASKAIESASELFTNVSDKIATLNAISKELKESNGLSADSFKKIASEFQELLGYMNDEASLADAIKDKMESLSAVQGDAYRQMLFNSEEYYEQNVLGNEQMINSISSGIENLFRNLSTAYDGDLNNWKTLAQGKADIETQLIASLNKAWESHFGTLMTQFNKMPNTPIATPQFDEEKARNEIKAKNPHLTPGRVEALVNMARNDFKQQIDEYQEFQKEVVKRNQELANMFSDVKFDAVDIKIGGVGKIGSGSKSKSGSSSKDSFEKYYSQLIDETIDTILSENERLEDAIAFAQEKLANAELKGDTKQQDVLNKQILEFAKQKKELSHKMAEELRKVGNDVRIQLGNMNIKGYENFNFANLTELDVAKITQSYDKLAVGASDAVKANIELQKSKFEELSSVILRIYGEEIPNLQKQWWSEDTNHRQQQIDAIHKIADIEKRAYDDKVKRIQLEQMLMDDSGKEYQAKEEEKYQLLLGLKLRYEDKIRQLKAQGLSQESEDVRKYVDLWVDAEEELLNMRKSMAERQREIGLKGYEERLKVLNDQKAAIKTITDLTIQMIKKETEVKKKAIQEEINGYQAVINKKKESLRKEKEDKDYKKELSEIEKQEEILNNKIAELSLDNSGDMNEKRLELEEELRELLEKKEELQNDKSLQNKEDLLDQELEAFEKEKQEEIDKLDEYLDKEGQLRQDALDMIKRNNKEMYEKLLEYNATYGDAMQEDIVKAWGLATDAANEFNNGQMDLLDILKDVTDEMAEQVRLQDELKNAHWTDIPLGNNTENSPSGSGSTGGSSWHDKKDKIAKQMQSNSKEWFNASDEQKKKLAQENEKLGQQIGAWKGSDGEWWIMINGKRMKLYDSIGVRHTGIETGFVGGKALSKGSQEFMKLMRGEEFNILNAGEIVANPRQMDNVMNKVIPGVLARNSKTPELKIDGGLVNLVINGNPEKDMVKLLRKETDRIANYTLDKLKGVMNIGY